MRTLYVFLGIAIGALALEPYALATDGVNGNSGPAMLDYDTNQVYDSQDPPHTLIINGQTITLTGHSTTTITGTATGTGTTGYVPKWTGASVLGNSVLYETASKIGLGVTNPAGLFGMINQLDGGALQTYAATHGLAGQNILHGYYNSVQGNEPRLYRRYLDIVSIGSPDGTYGDSVIRFLCNGVALDTPAVECMRIDSGGTRVTGANPTAYVVGTSSTSAPSFVMQNSSGVVASMFVGSPSSWVADTAGFYFDTSHFSILNSGGSFVHVNATNTRVGINTTNPATTLDVNGGATINGNVLAGTGTTTTTDVFNFRMGDQYIKGMTLEGYGPRLRLLGGTYGGYSDGPLIIEFANGSGKVYRISQASTDGSLSMGAFGGVDNLSMHTSGAVGVATSYSTSVALNIGGTVKAANQIAIAGGYWVYSTDTGTGTSTATALDVLRTGTLTISVTSTATATSTNMGTLLAVTPVHFTLDPGTTTYNSAAVSATPTIRVTPSVVVLPNSTKTLSATQTVTQTDLATTTPTASKIPLAGTDGKLAIGWLPSMTATAMATVTFATLSTGTVSSTGTSASLGTVVGPATAGYYKIQYDVSGNVAGATNSCKFSVVATGCSYSGASRVTSGTAGAGNYFAVAGSARVQLVSDTSCTYAVLMDTMNNGLYCVVDSASGSLWLERIAQ